MSARSTQERLRPDLRHRLMSRLSIGGLDSCWGWQGSHSEGYGTLWDGQRKRHLYVHRAAYMQFVGAIPADRELDHLCRNRDCGNPRHLEIVTTRENVLRGVGLTAENARKTHCPNGHVYAGENLKVTPEGYRICLTCRRERDRKRWPSRKENRWRKR